MIRAACLVAAALAGPAGAATVAACDGLAGRIGLDVEETASVAGVCLYRDVRFGAGDTRFFADRLSLGGDIDALPDAMPVNLNGGIFGWSFDPQVPGQPGLDWLLRQQAGPDRSLTFDVTFAAGVLRINSFVFRAGGENELALTARVAGVPEVWPVDALAASAVTVQALDLRVFFDGMFEELALVPLGAAVLDLSRPAPDQVADLRRAANAALMGFAETDQAGNAAQLRAFLDSLPHPRGMLEVSLAGSGVRMVQLAPFVMGRASPDLVERLATAAALDVFWTPEAP